MIAPQQLLAARRILVKRAEQLDPNGTAELFLSGGVDSATILFALLEAGRRPHCLTFEVAGTSNVDVVVSQKLCAFFGLRHTTVTIPRSLDQLLADVRWVLTNVDWRRANRIKKTIVQCCHPTRYLYPALDGNLALWGLGGDDIFRTETVYIRQESRDGWQVHSRKRRTFADNPRYSNYHILDLGRRVFGIQTESFYHFPAWWAFAQQFPTPETNHPQQKYLSVGAFADYWRRGSWYRHNAPYQVISGLRQYHNLLLSLPEYQQHRDVLAVYNRLANELSIEVGTDVYPDYRLEPLDFADYAAEWG